MFSFNTARFGDFGTAQDELAYLSFLHKFYNSGYDTSQKLNVCALHDALYSLYLKENQQKILILYFHNHETDFSIEFCRILSEDGETKNLLESNFIVHVWDVGEDRYLPILMETLGNVFQLMPCADMVRSKQPAAIFIAAVDMDFQICSILRDIPSLRNMHNTMSILVKSIFLTAMEEVEASQNNDESNNDCGYVEFQQKMLDWMGNRDYDRYEANELDSLKEKISFALFGVPVDESGYSEKQKEETQKMYNIILETNNEFSEFEWQVTMAIMYNCLIPLDSNSNQQYSPVPVFVLRKCTSSEYPCRIIIDHTRRVYKSWNSYLEDNKFCKCLMVVPEEGRYTEDGNGKIKLQKLNSPACRIGHTILQATDISTTVLGIGSTTVMVAAAVPAIAVGPVALLGAAAVGAGVGAYSIGRSIYTLIDRGSHKQSLNVSDAESRGAYLNIAAGLVGFAGAGANAAVSQLAANGATVGTTAKVAVNTLGVANIGIGGLAVSNSAVEVFMQWWIHDETPSALSVLQLSTSILFFGHSIYSFKTAGAIIEESQASTMQSYRDSLGSNKQSMSGNKCEFHNCGMSSKKDKSLRFYKFPTNDTERCKKWILNSGNGNLVDISPKSLKKKVICSKHFSEEQVLPKRLPLDAVPVKYISDSSSSNETVASSPDLKVKSVSKTYGNRQSTSLQVDQSEESGSSGNQYLQELQNLPVGQKRKRKRNFLSEENDRLRKEVDSLKQQLNNEKKKVIKAQLSSKILFKECTSQFSASLVKMQLAHRSDVHGHRLKKKQHCLFTIKVHQFISI